MLPGYAPRPLEYDLSSSNLGSDLAIVILNHTHPYAEQQLRKLMGKSYKPNPEIGQLVTIYRREGDTAYGYVLAKVYIQPLNPDQMSWDILLEQKGYVITDEIRNGLLAKMYGSVNKERPFVHPKILAGMPRKWHLDAAVLNTEMGDWWASGRKLQAGQVKYILQDRRKG